MTNEKAPQVIDLQGLKSGTLVGIRTPNLLIRSQVLYPVELQAHCSVGLVGTLVGAENIHEAAEVKDSLSENDFFHWNGRVAG